MNGLRDFGPAGIIAIVVILLAGNLLGALLTIAWVLASRTPWHELGLVRSRSWVRDVLLAIVGGVALALILKAVVIPLLGVGAVSRSYRYLAGNTAALPAMIALIVVGAGFGEELIWRGFLFERMRALVGTSARALTLIVTSALFALAHYPDQRWPGVTQAAFTGTAFGLAYLRVRRIWPVMIAHAAFDLSALAMIYWRVDESVARAVFG